MGRKGEVIHVGVERMPGDPNGNEWRGVIRVSPTGVAAWTKAEAQERAESYAKPRAEVSAARVDDGPSDSQAEIDRLLVAGDWDDGGGYEP